MSSEEIKTVSDVEIKTDNEKKKRLIKIYDIDDKDKDNVLLTVEIVKNANPPYMRYKFKKYGDWIIKVL